MRQEERNANVAGFRSTVRAVHSLWPDVEAKALARSVGFVKSPPFPEAEVAAQCVAILNDENLFQPRLAI